MAFGPWLFVWIKNMEKRNEGEYKNVADTQKLGKKKNNTSKTSGGEEQHKIEKNNSNGKKESTTKNRTRTNLENKQKVKKISTTENKAHTNFENNIGVKRKNITENKARTNSENSINVEKKNTTKNSVKVKKKNTSESKTSTKPENNRNIEKKNATENDVNVKKKNTIENKTHTNFENNIGVKKKNTTENKAYTNSENNQNVKKKHTTENKARTNSENNKNVKKKNTSTKKSKEPALEMKSEPENTGQRQKHWTQLNREYRLRRQGIYVEEQSYREIPKKIDLPLNGCGFGDEYFLFEGPDGSPKYEEPNLVWDSFIDWLEKLCKRYKKYKDTTRQGEYFLGQELIVHASQRNLYKIYCYISLNWVGFRDGFLLQKGCPEIVIEFVRGVLANKMTEKQMWGTVDDRCPGGTVIVFDEELMPKEGEDTGTIKFEYHPNFVEERMGKMKRSNGML